MREIECNQTVKKIKEIKSEKKAENPNGTITLNEALTVIQDKFDITKMGLRIAANRDGFKSVHIGQGKETFLLDEEKFKKWINIAVEISDEFMLVATAAKELSITTAYVYVLIEKYKIKTKKAGAGKGKMYVYFESLKNVYNAKKEGKRK